MLTFLDRPITRAGVYVGFGFVAFLIALGATFPDEQIKDIITVELEKQLGGKYDVKVSDLDVWWFTGVSLKNVTITERVDPDDIPVRTKEEEEAGLPEEGPMKVTIPRLSGRLALLRSLLGPAVEFEVELGGGTIEGYVQMGSESRDVHVEMDALDLRKTVALTAFLGLPFFGEMTGEIDLQMDPEKPSVIGGTIELQGSKLTVGPATIKTDKFPPITYLEIPQTNFGTLDIKLAVDDGSTAKDGDDKDDTKPAAERAARREMKIETFKWAGRDIRGDMWGAFKLASRVDQTSADVRMRMQFDENFVKKNNLGPLLNVNEIRKGKNKDWFGLRLYGTLKNIRFKGNPAAASGPGEDEASEGDAP